MKPAAALFLLILSGMQAFAQLQVPPLFSDHMVFQREKELVIWGWAKPKETVRVQLASLEGTVKAGADGKWLVRLPAQPAGGPFELVISAKKDVFRAKDVWIGEVWLCSGQSNMEWPLSAVNNAEAEIAAANHPMIRFFDVPHRIATSPQQQFPDGQQPWAVCSPGTISNFSAVAYFMARELQPELGVAIGLIGSNWGGTVSETWTSIEAISQDPDFQEFAGNSLDAYLTNRTRKTKEALEALFSRFPDQGPDMQGNTGLWAAPGFSTSGWQTMALPGLWENKGLPQFDGVVWFRKEVTLTKEDLAGPASLALGPIDDADHTWVNGQLVGQTNGYNVDRQYEVPAAVLKEGTNVIAIRVLDTGGGGGIYANAGVMMLTTAAGKLALEGEWRFRPGPNSEATLQQLAGPNDAPALLFNGMIAPLLPFSIGGAIWYQGESNADRAYQYRRIFPLMIEDWRTRWNDDFPFLWVQLANFRAAKPEPGESDWAELREAQHMTLSLPHTGEAVIIDIGEAYDIHPRNKQDVGKRLALAALHVAYDRDLVFSGPTFAEATFDNGMAYLRFDNVGGGLVAKDKYGYVRGFAIAGEDRVWHWAQAWIDEDQVTVFSPEVPSPVAVRYGWADNPEDVNLYNAEGLPASPFRTDDWKGITQP